MQHVQTHCNYDKHRQVTMLKFDRLFYITETLLTPKKKLASTLDITEQPNTVPKFFSLIIIHLKTNFLKIKHTFLLYMHFIICIWHRSGQFGTHYGPHPIT